MTNKIKIGVHGATGKMGKVLLPLLEKHDRCIMAYQYSPSLNGTNLVDLCQKSEVVIDFSIPEATSQLISQAKKTATKLVICTTGLTTAQQENLERAAEQLSILYTSNTTLGANLLALAAEQTAKYLADSEFDTEVLDIHHSLKKDSPSGTALMFGKAIARGRQMEFNKCSRSGLDRKQGDIGFTSIRAGNISGEHQVIFAGKDEIITLNHRVTSKVPFAEGAIKAALWLCDQPPGLYNMQHIWSL